MRDIDLSAKPVNISIEPYGPLAQRFTRKLQKDLIANLEEYASDLVSRLHINCQCTVSIAPRPARHDSLRPVHVSIGAGTCELPVTGDASSPERFMRSLQQHLEQIVCDNRHFFVTDRLARDYRRAWGLVEEHDRFLYDLL